MNGGHSPHAAFVRALHKKDFFVKTPGGPQTSSANRTPQKPKWSEQMKRMLEAPPGDGDSMATKFPKTDAAEKPPELNHKCMFKTAAGTQCKLPHLLNSRFCKRHQTIFDGPRVMAVLTRAMHSLQSRRIAEVLDKWLLQEGLRRSKTDNEEKAKKMLKAQTRVYQRMLSKGLRAIPTEGIAIVFSLPCVIQPASHQRHTS